MSAARAGIKGRDPVINFGTPNSGLLKDLVLDGTAKGGDLKRDLWFS